MKVKRAACIPLITHDPFFSVWSPADTLYGADTCHWSQNPMRMFGFVKADGKEYCFMGRRADRNRISQTSMEVTATSTKYVFENEQVLLEVTFLSPLLPDDLKLLSRPCSYICVRTEKRQAEDVSVRLEISSDFVRCTPGPIYGNRYEISQPDQSFSYVTMYKGNQHILGSSGDNVTIDWGSVYLAARSGGAQLSFNKREERLEAVLSPEDGAMETLLLAFDDILSINYLGDARPGYWKKYYRNLPEVLEAGFREEKELFEKCAAFDREMEQDARRSGGEELALLTAFSYRQVIAAHKLIADGEENPVFLSKECDSNGCIGTVDVSYPSVPMLLYYNTELAKGLLRPIFAFADRPVWDFDFAPHDLGRYPYATGQVYGLLPENREQEYSEAQGMIIPFYADFPAGSRVYDFRMQMPVEECGNMLIMTAAVCRMENSAEFAVPHMPVLKKWVEYLIRFGKDPDEQLCTDDFAGHLRHNVNLAGKAVMGIEAYAQLEKMLGETEEYEKFHAIAREYAAYWEENAAEGDHTLLAYGSQDSWSLKYNIIWDRFFASGLFSDRVFERETDCYLGRNKAYGVPLDSRKSYTKSDWILWCTAMTQDMDKRKRLMEPVVRFLQETGDRVPFSDWYDTETGEYCHFKGRSVQGGIFMPILLDRTKGGQLL